MPVRLLVGANGPSGEVQEHHRFGEPDSHAKRVVRAIPALPKTALFFQRVNILPSEPLSHVRYEVRLNTLEATQKLRRLDEVVLFLGVSVEKFIITIEDKIVVIEQLHVKWRRSAANQSCRRAHGVMFMPDVGRNREDTALLPLEGLLSAVFVPHGSGSLPFDDHDRLVKELAARDRLLSRRHFQNDRVIHHRIGQIDKRAVGVSSLPKTQANLSTVFDKETRVNRDT